MEEKCVKCQGAVAVHCSDCKEPVAAEQVATHAHGSDKCVPHCVACMQPATHEHCTCEAKQA